MLRRSGHFWGWCGGIGLALGGFGCGDENDPSAITNLELKSPSALEIIDNGAGKITLQWRGSNPEDDFEGYNVYGAKITDTELAAIGVKKGSPIKLLGSDGEPVDAVKTAILPKFDYTAANTTNALPNAAAALATDDELTLSKMPIHKRNPADATDPLLPTCVPKSGVCTINSSTTAPTGITANGIVTFDLGATMDLTAGSQYCFFVLSVQNEGKEVSEASSNVACVTPRYKLAFSWAATDNQKFDLRSLLTACSASTTNSCGTTVALGTDASSGHQDLRFLFGNKEIVTLASSNLYIKRLGYAPSGFGVVHDRGVAITVDSNNVEHAGGYNIEGQSSLLEDNGLYLLAVGDKTRVNTKDFHYHYLWVNGSKDGTTVAFELRLAKNQNEL